MFLHEGHGDLVRNGADQRVPRTLVVGGDATLGEAEDDVPAITIEACDQAILEIDCLDGD